MGKINSRAKGKSGELELAHTLEEWGLHARRGQQFSGTSESPDVIVTEWPEVHVECKRVQSLNIQQAMLRAVEEAGAKKLAILCHRKNNQPWMTTLLLTDFMKVSTLCPPMFYVDEDDLKNAVQGPLMDHEDHDSIVRNDA